MAQQISKSYVSSEDYLNLYQLSIKNPNKFWDKIGKDSVEWQTPYTSVYENKSWFLNGKLNVTHNCLDRHIRDGHGDQFAIISHDEDDNVTKLTYSELRDEVNKLGNFMVSEGLRKGDRVVISMPLVPEGVIAMLACARLGIIHSVIFAGFSAPAIKTRIEHLNPNLIITVNYTKRRGKKINLQEIIREANIEAKIKTIVLNRPDQKPSLLPHEIDWQNTLQNFSVDLEPIYIDSEDPLFILYTSGTTGKPKGIVHTSGGYSVYSHFTCQSVFNLVRGDIYWCTADIGWITGHSYVVYGPLSVGATIVLAEGVPDYPDHHHWWSIIEKHKVQVFYTSPTALRLLMKYDPNHISTHNLSSLSIIGSVGEPLNPEVWHFIDKHIGKGETTIVDTWWQTETGGHAIVTLPAMPQKPGRAGLPFFGIEADVVDNQGKSVLPNVAGHLVLKNHWPSAMRTHWKDHDRFQKSWTAEDHYLTGDLAKKDEDGYIQIIGRSDDVLNISGHRIGSAEIENAVVTHPSVAESAVIGVADDLRGEVAMVFVSLKNGQKGSEELAKEIIKQVIKEIGHHAVIKEVKFIDKLPKTRSGKIMRRLLRSEMAGDPLGDTSTLED